MVDLEKQKRLQVQEDKLEKSSALMQELVERDKRIVTLQNEIRDLRTDHNNDLETISQNYFGLTQRSAGKGVMDNVY